MRPVPHDRYETTVFERWGVRRAVNGVGPATRMGGLPLHPEVLDAMAQATQVPVRMDELEARAGAALAEMLGAEGAYVTSGAAAALTLATAAAITGGDSARADALPRVSDGRRHVVILAAHRDPYDRAIEAAGAEIVVVGYPTSTHVGEIQRALADEVAAVLYRPGRPGNHPSLAEICDLARDRGIHVIVDGALYAPPLVNLHRWFADGAALVALSGGKHFRGPQASGILCGRRDLIEMVAAQHQDMDERETTWPVLGGTPPRHGVGRAMKVGREQIAGLLAAVERYIAAPGADDRPGIEELERLKKELDRVGLPARWHDTSVLGVPVVDVLVRETGADIDDVVRRLRNSSPPVYLEEGDAWQGILTVHPMALLPGDAEIIAGGLSAAIWPGAKSEGKNS